MRNLTTLIITVLISSAAAYAQQDAFDQTIKEISIDLTNQLNNRGIKNVAVANFTFKGQSNTTLGNYISDELSKRLVRTGGKFSVISRTRVKTELYNIEQSEKVDLTGIAKDVNVATTKEAYETKTQQQAQEIDAISKVGQGMLNFLKTGKPLKDADAIVYGTIKDLGDVLQIDIEAIKNNKKQENVGISDGKLVKTPTIANMLGQKEIIPVNRPTVSSPSTGDLSLTTTSSPLTNYSPIPNEMATYKYNNLQFEVKGCTQSGRDVECKVNILANDYDHHLKATTKNTRFIEAEEGKEFHASQIKLVDITSSPRYGTVEKTIIANHSIEATITFKNVIKKIISISSLEVRFYDQKLSRYHTAKLRNISMHGS